MMKYSTVALLWSTLPVDAQLARRACSPFGCFYDVYMHNGQEVSEDCSAYVLGSTHTDTIVTE